MKASTTKIKPNPVGKIVTQQMRELLDKIDAATSKKRSRIFIDADWSEGYAFEDGGVEPIGPATVKECTTIKVGIKLHGQLDAMSPIIPQLVAWLNKCAADLTQTSACAATLKETRDIRALRLAAEGEVRS